MPDNKLALSVLFMVLLGATSATAGYVDAVRQGNKAFVKKDYTAALEQYRAAETDLPTSPEIDYNIGGTLFEQGKYEEATDKFTRALNTTDPQLAAAAHFNLGNTYFRMQDYLKSIQSFEESLKMNPKDMDAKYNLELARKMLKENSKPEKQDQKDQQQKKQDQQQQDQKQQDQKKDEQQQKDQEQQQKPDDSDQNKENENEKEQKQQANPKDSKKMSKEDAERILNALRDNEQDTQKKLKRQVQTGEYNGKDW